MGYTISTLLTPLCGSVNNIDLGSYVICSTYIGIARASDRERDKRRFLAFCVCTLIGIFAVSDCLYNFCFFVFVTTIFAFLLIYTNLYK